MKEKKMVSHITWTPELGEWLGKQAGGKRKIGEYVRTIMNLIKNETLVLQHQGQVVAIERQLTAEQVKLANGKVKKISGVIQTVDAPPDVFNELMVEIRQRLKERPDINTTLGEIRKEQQKIAEVMEIPLPDGEIEPPPPPPAKKD